MCQNIFIPESIIEKWNSLTFKDNFIFTKVMQEPELCRHTLELLLGIKIKKLEYPKSEFFFKESFDSRGIRLDVYTKDDEHCFDIEMQTTNNTNLLKRARYYSSCIDVDELQSGKDFSELKENIIIFLCLKDPFNKGLPVYTFTTKCSESPELPDDETRKIFYNISSWEKNKNEGIRNFLEFIKTNIPKDTFTKQLEHHAEKALQNVDIRRQFMTLEMELRSRYKEGLERGEMFGLKKGLLAGKAEGLQAGQAKAKLEDAVIAVRKFNLPVESVAKEYGIAAEMIRKQL